MAFCFDAIPITIAAWEDICEVAALSICSYREAAILSLIVIADSVDIYLAADIEKTLGWFVMNLA